MVLELCGGTPSEVTVAGAPSRPSASSIFRSSEIKRLAGLAVPLPEMRRVLERLGFFVGRAGRAG